MKHGTGDPSSALRKEKEIGILKGKHKTVTIISDLIFNLEKSKH